MMWIFIRFFTTPEQLKEIVKILKEAYDGEVKVILQIHQADGFKEVVSPRKIMVTYPVLRRIQDILGENFVKYDSPRIY